MLYENLTLYEQQRFSHADICPICRQRIKRSEKLALLKTPYGKTMVYNFFHNSCLVEKGEKDNAERK